MHAIFGLRLSYAIVQNTNIFLHRQTVDIRQLMLNPYEVIRAAPWLRDEVDMVFLCVHKDLYGLAPLFSPARSFSLTSIQLAKMVMNPWHFFLEKTTATPKTWTKCTRIKSLKNCILTTPFVPTPYMFHLQRFILNVVQVSDIILQLLTFLDSSNWPHASSLSSDSPHLAWYNVLLSAPMSVPAFYRYTGSLRTLKNVENELCGFFLGGGGCTSRTQKNSHRIYTSP